MRANMAATPSSGASRLRVCLGHLDSGGKHQHQPHPGTGGVTGAAASADDTRHALLEKIEPRLRGIYEEKEFGENPGRIPIVFEADWLPDSSGYTILEPVPGETNLVLAQYDAASGERSLATPGERHSRDDAVPPPAPGPGISNGGAAVSPDGKRIAYVQSDSSQVIILNTNPSFLNTKSIILNTKSIGFVAGHAEVITRSRE